MPMPLIDIITKGIPGLPGNMKDDKRRMTKICEVPDFQLSSPASQPGKKLSPVLTYVHPALRGLCSSHDGVQSATRATLELLQ